jgi:hypothetical protein
VGRTKWSSVIWHQSILNHSIEKVDDWGSEDWLGVFTAIILYVYRKRGSFLYCHIVWVTRLGMEWWMDLLTTYTHHLELQVITAPSLISTIHKSPEQVPSLFQPEMSSPASNSGDPSAFCTQVLPVWWISHNWTLLISLSWPGILVI